MKIENLDTNERDSLRGLVELLVTDQFDKEKCCNSSTSLGDVFSILGSGGSLESPARRFYSSLGDLKEYVVSFRSDRIDLTLFWTDENYANGHSRCSVLRGILNLIPSRAKVFSQENTVSFTFDALTVAISDPAGVIVRQFAEIALNPSK